ncbi:alpha/beta hydrolase [Brachybacterium subflavum]|uniref:alpha/beta hydrolase n=1 Tax=Brachybacterium subflavum TaxID=2585206 RepID=UPI001D0D22A3|nr:alpha/beta hydrolase [Brachybacterium subflavum]
MRIGPAPRSTRAPSTSSSRRLLRAVGRLARTVHADVAPRATRRMIRRAAGRVATTTPLSASGFLGASMAGWIATSPSLLPRTWWMWAANYALSTTYGYASGVVLGRTGRMLVRRLPHPAAREPLSPRNRETLRWGGAAALVGITAYSWTRGALRQREISVLVDREPKNLATHAVGTAAGLGIFAGVLMASRVVGATARLYRLLLRSYLPPLAVAIGSALLTAATLAVAIDRLVRGQVLERMIERAEQANRLLSPDLRRPASELVSGSIASKESWESLGAAGRRIVSSAASAEEIARATGRSASTPIRVYAGKRSDRTLEQTVAAVIAELDRTRAWEREVLVLFTGTGTGWLQEWSLSAVEFLTGGNCATASLQYSVYSSALNYVLDRRTPQRAGRLLFEAVRGRLDAMPPHERPRLFAAGESLGSFAGHAAFGDVSEMLARIDGAVWTGTPGFTPIWRELTEARRPGTPEIAPVVGDGEHVRFITEPADLHRPFHGRGPAFGPWLPPRVAYVQHASDPVVWWQPSLLVRKPDWLRERVGRDVTGAIGWAPWITFWQIAADMPLSAEVDGGHGHSYHEEVVLVWAAVLGLDPSVDRGRVVRAIQQRLGAG